MPLNLLSLFSLGRFIITYDAQPDPYISLSALILEIGNNMKTTRKAEMDLTNAVETAIWLTIMNNHGCLRCIRSTHVVSRWLGTNMKGKQTHFSGSRVFQPGIHDAPNSTEQNIRFNTHKIRPIHSMLYKIQHKKIGQIYRKLNKCQHIKYDI
jgi:hypothetical protein